MSNICLFASKYFNMNVYYSYTNFNILILANFYLILLYFYVSFIQYLLSAFSFMYVVLMILCVMY